MIIADNGRKALEILQQECAICAVLMDIQMPELDGYEATRNIRKSWNAAELPIIAMTAHAMTGEKEKCLAVGMNDYVAKPIDPVHLYATMLRWLRQSDGAQRSGQGGAEHRVENLTGNSLLPDLPGIDFPTTVKRCGGNRELAREIVITFRDQHQTAADDVRKAVETGSVEKARELAHLLKGVAGTLGADQLAATMLQFETDLQNGDEKRFGLQIPLIAQQLSEVFTAADILERMDMAEPAASQPPEGDRLERYEELITELYRALDNNSLAAKKHFEAIKQMLPPLERDEIARCIGRLEFAKALVVLGQLSRAAGISITKEN